MQKNPEKIIERAPVIAIMGHVDHGKSTLLDYIRKTNIVDTETGGITQKISAYEVTHTTKEGKVQKITFLDTPGHEAFQSIRARGAGVADIAILVVSAEDGARPQTLEALKVIQEAGIPFIVAINKIDREGADVDRTKTNLAENGIYVEGYGGDVPFVPISAKTGQGIPDLLDMMSLVVELEELSGSPDKPATGVVIEANLDRKKGISASLVIKDGTLKCGTYIVAGSSISPVRIMENFLGKPIKEATFSSPVRIIGWSALPEVGSTFVTFQTKKEAEAHIEKIKTAPIQKSASDAAEDLTPVLPIVIKASEVGSLEAIQHEINKIKNEKIKLRIISSGVGDISENDIKTASALAGTILIGFNVKMDSSAKSVAEKLGTEVQIFDIIYKLSEWLTTTVLERAPRVKVEEMTGVAKIVRLFSKVKDRQVIGGRVEKGDLLMGSEVKILRREFEVGRGRIRELQRQKNRVSDVPEGQEFGAMVESKMEIAPGDRLESFRTVEK